MPVPALNAVEGEDIVAVLDSLEKQRKELLFILENLDTSNVNGLNASVINAGTINGERLHIDSTVSFAEGYDPEGLRTEMHTEFAVVDGLIASKVSMEQFNALGQRVGNAESSITQTAQEIRSEVSASVSKINADIIAANSSISQTATAIRSEVSASVIALDGKISAANSSITQTAAAIRSEVFQADQALDGKIASANSSITQLSNSITSKVSSTDFTGANMVSMINQTASTITLSASKINMLGITNVASILYIGDNYMDNSLKAIRFRGSLGGVSIASGSTDNLYIGAAQRLELGAYYLDLAGVSNITWGNNKPVAVWG